MSATAKGFFANLFTPNDEQLMWRVRADADPEAFAELARRWQPAIERLCIRLTGNAALAQDIAQETFLRLFAHRDAYRSEGYFGTYLRRIAINLCHDELRKRARRNEIQIDPDDPDTHLPASGDLPSQEPTPDEDAASKELSERVRAAVARLPESHRSVMVLRHYEGLKFREIADLLSLPEGTVKTRMGEALNLLARQLHKTLELKGPMPSKRNKISPEALVV